MSRYKALLWILTKQRKKGLSLSIILSCNTCKWTTNYYTSWKVKNNSKVQSCYEVNILAVNLSWSCWIRKAMWVFKFTRASTSKYNQKNIFDTQKIIADAYNNVASRSHRRTLLMHTITLLLVRWTPQPMKQKVLGMKIEYVISIFHMMRYDRKGVIILWMG